MPSLQPNSFKKSVNYNTISPQLGRIIPPHSLRQALLLYGPTMAQKNQSQINSMTYNIGKKR